jgi:hypothetical protein
MRREFYRCLAANVYRLCRLGRLPHYQPNGPRGKILVLLPKRFIDAHEFERRCVKIP